MKMNFYTHEKKTDHIYVFTEGYSADNRFVIGVIVGSEKVLVIDSGLGCDGNGLRDYIEEVIGSDKPIICACTHGHIDHIGSSQVFDAAYLNEKDFYQLESACDTQRRKNDLRFFAAYNEEVIAYCEKRMLINTGSKFFPVNEGDMFDLGGVTVTAIGVPGHSYGSMAYYCADEGIAFVGDSVGSVVALGRLKRKEILAYHDTIERFISFVKPDTQLYSGHCAIPQSIQAAHNIAQAAKELGLNQNTEKDTLTGIGITPKDIPPAMLRVYGHFFGNNCIQYNSGVIDRE